MNGAPAPREPELVVLLDEAGNATGTAPKSEVHHEHTPLHLAFSCYLFSSDGRLLLTRRASHKPTWPGVWTNSCCGHPAPGEDLTEAVARRVRQELGVGIRDLRLTLPAFRYDATMTNGVMENELCPVFTAVTDDVLAPDPEEVEATEWVEWVSFRDEVISGRRDVSPWCRLQAQALAEVERSPGDFAEASPADLPAAVRPGGQRCGSR